jgi:hypothetical protein
VLEYNAAKQQSAKITKKAVHADLINGLTFGLACLIGKIINEGQMSSSLSFCDAIL